MRILELIAKLGLDGRAFKAGMREATNSARNAGKDINKTFGGQLAGAFGTAALASYAAQTLKLGGTLHDTAKKMATNVESMQEEKFWAEQNSATLEDLTAAYRGLGKARDDALSGNAEKMDAFKALGIDKKSLESNTLSQTFRKIAETIRTTDFGTDTQPLLEKVLGKGATALIPAFSESLADAAAEARKLGIVLSESVVSELDEAGDAVDKLVARFRGPMATAIAFLAEQLRNTWDFLDIAIGGEGARIVGAIEKAKELGVKSLTPAGQAAIKKAGDEAFAAHKNEIIDSRIASGAPTTAMERTKRTIDHTEGGTVKAAADEYKRLVDLAKARRDLEQSVYKVQLQQMSAADQQAVKEKELQKQIKAIEFEETLAGIAGKNPDDDANILGMRKTAWDMLGELSNSPATMLASNSLTAEGRLGGGRNVISTGESEVVKVAKETLKVNTAAKEAVVALNTKIKGVTTLRASR